MIFYEYGFFNELKADKEYYKRVYKQRGYKRIKIKKVKSDTKGLNMYEIECNI